MFCHDLEGWGPVSRLRPFDTTPCYEEGILFSVLSAAIFIVSLARSLTLAPLESRHLSPWSRRILVAKIILLSGAVVASTSNLVNILLTHIDIPVFMSYILEPLALLSTICLTYLNHTRQCSSSTTLLLFWPLFATVGGIWVRTRHDIGLELFWQIVISKVVIIVFGLLFFALECISPECGLGLQLAEKRVADSPILTANVFSIWSFSWMTPLMKKGARQYISEQDLPALLSEDESEKLGNNLENAMSK